MKRKHTLRRLLSMVCTIVMIVTMVPVLPAAAADEFYDNMESYTVDSALPVSGTAEDAKYTLWADSNGTYTVVSDNGNKVLNQTTVGADGKTMVQLKGKFSGSYVFDVKMKHVSTDYYSAITMNGIKLPGADGTTGNFEVWMDGKDISTRFRKKVPADQKISGDGTYNAFLHEDGTAAGEKVVPTVGEWYTVRIIADADAQEVTTVLYDAEGTKMGWRTVKAASMDSGVIGLYTQGNTTTYFDEIRVTPGLDEADSEVAASGSTGGDDTAVSGGGMVEFIDEYRIMNKEAVAITAGMGLFAGKEGNRFDPEGVLTRAEMATVIVKMLRGNAFNADNFKGYNKFSDTADYQGGWAEGYINACVQMGIVAGYGDGTFKPEKPVTTAEALTMIINALKVNAGEGEWPATIMAKAEEMKLYGDLATKPGTHEALTRDQLAVLVYEGMCYSPSGTSGWKVSDPRYSDLVFDDIAAAIKANNGAEGLIEVVGEDALANKVYELKIAEGFITANQDTSDNKYTVLTPMVTDTNGVQTLGTPIKFNLTTGLDKIGHYVTVYYRETWSNENKPGVVYSYVDQTEVITVGEAIDTSREYKELFDQNYGLADYVLKVNGEYEITGLVAKNTIPAADYTSGSVAKTGDYLIADGVIVGYMAPIPVYAAKVNVVNNYGNKTIELNSVLRPIPNGEDNDRIREYKGIAKGDYVTYTVVGSGDNATYVLTKVGTVTGMVSKNYTNTDGKKVITVKGVDYVQFDSTNNKIGEFKTLGTPNFTDNYTFYITEDNQYIGYEKTQGGLDLSATVFILGELKGVTTDRYGNNTQKTYARGVDMNGNEVNLLIKVEKNVDEDGFPLTENPDDEFVDPASDPVNAGGFFAYELSTDSHAKKEGVYKLTAYGDTYDEDNNPIFYGKRTFANGAHYAMTAFTGIGSQRSYSYDNTLYMLLEGTLTQGTPLAGEVRTKWSTSVNNTGADMVHHHLLSRSKSGSQMIEVTVVVVTGNATAAAGSEVIYVSEENRTPAATTGAGYIFDVYDYKTGTPKQITVKTDDPVLVEGCIKQAGYWHTIPGEDGTYSKLYKRVNESAPFDYNDGNDATQDELYRESVLYGEKFKELVSDELSTTDLTRGRGASGTAVVDVRSEEDIEADGIGKITTIDRIADLAVDHPEIVVTFDLCFDTNGEKMLTLFVTDVTIDENGGAGGGGGAQPPAEPEPERVQYTVTTTRVLNGQLSVDKTKAYEGETVTVTGTARNGYKLQTITVNGGEVQVTKVNDTTYTFTMPAKAVTVTGVFAETYPITTVCDSEKGSVEVVSAALPGETVTFEVKHKPGYILDTIAVTNAGGDVISNTDTFVMPEGGATITVTFKEDTNEYSVTVDQIDNGSIAIAVTETGNAVTSGDKVLAGTWLTVTATPANGYVCKAIYVNGEAIDGTSFAVGGETKVTALFLSAGTEFYEDFSAGSVSGSTFTNGDAMITDSGANTMSLATKDGATVLAIAGDTTLPAKNKGATPNWTTEFAAGDSYEITMRLKNSWNNADEALIIYLPGVDIDVEGTSKYYALWLNGVKNATEGVEANTNLRLRVRPGNASAGGKTVSTSNVQADEWITLKFVVDETVTVFLNGTEMTGLALDNVVVKTGEQHKFIMDVVDSTAHTGTATTYVDYIAAGKVADPNQPATYAVTVEQPAVGATIAVTGADDLTNVEEGTVLTITAAVNEGYALKTIKANGEVISTTSPATITVTEAVTITAEVEEIEVGATYAVTVEQPANGVIEVTGADDLANVAAGTELTIAATANAGYVLKSIKANGEEISATSPVTYTVTEAVTITAEIETIPTYAVTVTQPANGEIAVTGADDLSNVAAGTELTITATADAGYVLKSIKANGTQISTTSPATYTVSAAATITAVIWPEGAMFHEDFSAGSVTDNVFTNGSATITDDGANTLSITTEDSADVLAIAGDTTTPSKNKGAEPNWTTEFAAGDSYQVTMRLKNSWNNKDEALIIYLPGVDIDVEGTSKYYALWLGGVSATDTHLKLRQRPGNASAGGKTVSTTDVEADEWFTLKFVVDETVTVYLNGTELTGLVTGTEVVKTGEHKFIMDVVDSTTHSGTATTYVDYITITEG